MGGGGSPNNNLEISKQGLGLAGAPKCSTPSQIFQTYPFPSVIHVGINSTKILPSDGQFLNEW
jgi:hypothetical protein